jgi:sulfate transport system ATP-binding protein
VRIVRLGFETRVELERDDGERLHAQLTRDEADELELRQGDIVFVRMRRSKTFA